MVSAGYAWNGILELTEVSALFHSFHRNVLMTISCTSMQTFASTSINIFIPSDIVFRKIARSLYLHSRVVAMMYLNVAQ